SRAFACPARQRADGAVGATGSQVRARGWPSLNRGSRSLPAHEQHVASVAGGRWLAAAGAPCDAVVCRVPRRPGPRRGCALIQAPLAIDRALMDPRLLGAALGEVASWQTWRIALKGAFGLQLDDEERALFGAIAGGRNPPAQRVRELWCVVGRRGGKSTMAAA